MSFTQLNPPLPVFALGKGKGIAHGVIDYGPEHDLVWVTAIDATGEIWCAPNAQIRMRQNWTLGRPALREPAENGDAARAKVENGEAARAKFENGEAVRAKIENGPARANIENGEAARAKIAAVEEKAGGPPPNAPRVSAPPPSAPQTRDTLPREKPPALKESALKEKDAFPQAKDAAAKEKDAEPPRMLPGSVVAGFRLRTSSGS
jgi:hypothetical protein